MGLEEPEISWSEEVSGKKKNKKNKKQKKTKKKKPKQTKKPPPAGEA